MQRTVLSGHLLTTDTFSRSRLKLSIQKNLLQWIVQNDNDNIVELH